MTYFEHVKGAYNQLNALNNATPARDTNFRSLYFDGPPPARIQKFFGEAAAYAFSPALGGINYLVGADPYMPSAITTSDGIKIDMPKTFRQKKKAKRGKKNLRRRTTIGRRSKSVPRRSRRVPRSQLKRRSFSVGGKRRSLEMRTPSAPVTRSRNLRTGVVTNFMGTRGGITLSARVYYDQINLTAPPGSKGFHPLFFNNWGSGTTYNEIVIHPNWKYYGLEQIYDIAKCFEEYRCVKFHIIYEPRSGTLINGGVTMASNRDIEYPEGKGIVAVSGYIPDNVPKNLLSSLPNAKTFVLYSPFVIPVDHQKGWKYNTVNSDTDQRLNYDIADQTASELRDVCAGILVMGGEAEYDNLSAVTDTQYTVGDVFIDFTFQFRGYGSATTNATGEILMKRNERRLRTLQSDMALLFKKQTLKEEKENKNVNLDKEILDSPILVSNKSLTLLDAPKASVQNVISDKEESSRSLLNLFYSKK